LAKVAATDGIGHEDGTTQMQVRIAEDLAISDRLSSNGYRAGCDGFERERDESITRARRRRRTMGVAGHRQSLKTNSPATFLTHKGSWGLGLGVHG